MAKEDIVKTAAQILPTLGSGTNSSLDDQLKEILLKRLLKEEKLDEDKQAQELAMRRQGAIDMERKAAQERAVQENCTHKKMNGTSAVVGIRDSSNNVHWACQNCGKPWINLQLPPELRPDGRSVGGPELTQINQHIIPNTVPDMPKPASLEGYGLLSSPELAKT